MQQTILNFLNAVKYVIEVRILREEFKTLFQDFCVCVCVCVCVGGGGGGVF
jgi:hypothetical protein